MSAGHLAVIDMQRVFADPLSPWATPRYADAAAGVQSLLPAFAGRVTFTRFLAPGRPAGAWRAYYDAWPFARRAPDDELWELTDGFADLAEHVLDTTTFGKWTPELAARVGPDGRLVLAGVSTDCCVLSTALAAADAGAEVLVVADACAGVDDDSHVKALQLMELYRPLVRVTTITDLLAETGP
ncbi:isochorismatase family protein [Streptomyces actinomycinicus]|uniref:Isochorismatase family protein n=1 Tax=Streptomyces actinomycinicus TaxID=1695166 RepID=A0A937EM25_9ACTN|nr:isochorismatase family protein [Streptomyces actinomycinicus]MBL1084514.1 isochorismatase family protein [Streptomyces actinomycinicus]